MMVRNALSQAAVMLSLAAVVGCAANVTVKSQPDPATVGKPLQITVSVENPLACPLTNPYVIVFVVSEDAPITNSSQSATTSGFAAPTDLEQLCDLFNNPALALCQILLDGQGGGDLPPEVSDYCCSDSDFAKENPGICDIGAATGEPRDAIREAVIAQARALGFPVDAILAAQEQATTSGPATSCTPLFQGPAGGYFECYLDDIPANASTTATLTFVPGFSGRYFTFVLLDGGATCADSALPGGSACDITSAVGSTAAPALSPASSLALVLVLAAIAGIAIVRRRRSIG